MFIDNISIKNIQLMFVYFKVFSSQNAHTENKKKKKKKARTQIIMKKKI